MTLTATHLTGRYVLEEQLGAGGFCEVWRATDTVLGRPVAVKLLHPGYARQPEALARFQAEALHAGALSHHSIARVLDYAEPADTPPYLVMELVDGPSLADVLGGGALDVARTMDIVAQVAAGLQAAHGAGLIHRDIKPANILFAPDGTVRITDFGIAHAVGSVPLTATGMVMGTPGYIAPERVSGGQTGAASDLYALGIVAYECLAGSRPFSGAPLDVAIAHRDRPLPPLPPSVPAEVAALVMMLTAKDPAWRPASAGEVADQAARLRDGLLAPAGHALAPAGPPLTAADNLLAPARAAAPSRPLRRRPLALAVFAFAAITCLLVISITGFASGSHPSGSHQPVSHPAVSHPAVSHPAVSLSAGSQSPAALPAGTPARSAAPRSPSAADPVSKRSGAGPSAVGASSGPARSTAVSTAAAQPGQHRQQGNNGKGKGKGNG
jgi:serine/threonine protein kinase